MKQPVEYLDEKLTAHRSLRKGAGIAWVIGAAVFLGGALCGAGPLFNYVWDGAGHFRFWPYGISILYVTMGLWFLRSMARLFFSSHHLVEDALERTVMARGLISMAGDAQVLAAIKDGPLSRTVDVIYRPAVKGLLKEEGPPLDLNRFLDAVAARLK